jgi:hypothetical protein
VVVDDQDPDGLAHRADVTAARGELDPWKAAARSRVPLIRPTETLPSLRS